MRMPKIVECGKGHLYDASMYGTCPYCGKKEGLADSDAGRKLEAGGRSEAAAFSETRLEFAGEAEIEWSEADEEAVTLPLEPM